MCSGQVKERFSGADPGFQVRGGALKKIAPSGGRRENFWGVSCEKSRFYAKKIMFFPSPHWIRPWFWTEDRGDCIFSFFVFVAETCHCYIYLGPMVVVNFFLNNDDN